MREKLRLRLTKRKEEQPKREEHQSILERDGGVEDHRRVEDLLQFINSADNKPSSSSKAAKRARHKQKKATPPANWWQILPICSVDRCNLILLNVFVSLQLEEKARLEAEAREREEQQLLEEQQRRQRQEEEEAALQKELLRLQELQHPRAAKKKKKEKAKENTAPPQNNPQPLRQTAQNVLDNLQNGNSRQLQTLMRLPDQKEPRIEPVLQPTTLHISEKGFSSQTNSSVALHSNTSSSQLEAKVKAKQSSKVASCEAAVKKAPEIPKSSDVTVKLANGTATAMDTKAPRIRPAEAPAPVPSPDSRKDDRNNIRSTSGKREQQQQQPPLTQTKEERRSPPVSNPSPSPPPGSQCEQPQQNGKPPSPESPQPKGKNKKNKKKKGDKINSSIG